MVTVSRAPTARPEWGAGRPPLARSRRSTRRLLDDGHGAVQASMSTVIS